ncbi:hypothetical protein B0A48_02145 [Cryoendolithus antarcticus]|uniref:ABM domain-containing protein n=1 Tax=Cryoendolithus antarcticus TaxID=1507870 RepID=A0A1V8TN95_9PEZI|nr:hypothetical protein B0A48_02145 [Cryoendolithus antarcticus]
MPDHIALLCTLHPASQEKRERILDLLRRLAREYYIKPSAKCIAWSYFTPAAKLTADATSFPLMGMEVYTDKSALQAQVDDTEHFQPYHALVKREGLYAKPEELQSWYLDCGFVARGEGQTKGGKGGLVSVSRLVCKDVAGAAKVLHGLREFSKWVESEEPGVLSYGVFTRPKAQSEVLVWVRYVSGKAIRRHDEAPEHRAAQKLMGPHLDMKKTETTVWREVEDSFVAPLPASSSAKL